MKLTINTDVLKKYNISFGQYLVLLSGYYGLDYDNIQDELVKKKLIEKNLFHNFPPSLPDSTKNLIAQILVESSDKIQNCGISDFEELARNLQLIYPDGIKPGKTYSWRGKLDDIAQKLRTLVVKYDFVFTEEEAVQATKEYIKAFNDYKYAHTLRNFILYTRRDEHGHYEMESMFMTIIENNRKQND